MSQHPRRGLILATVCLAVFAINLDTTIVNVALPDLTRQLGASTRDLQWIVDGYNLAFAALVLTGGAIGDRFGRRPVLLIGLVGFAAASALGAATGNSGHLIAVRFVMGGFAALIYPTTLSIITNAFPERGERLKAIGVWGAVTGLGVAVAPVTGGLLLAHFWWGSIFLALVPVALIAAGLAYVLVPESRASDRAHLDFPGLLTSSGTIGLLVFTIIEAPSHGWLAARSLGGFAGTLLLGVVFTVVEARAEHPMLDVTLFRTRAFSAASSSVTVAFFALFGFIFLITQYFQFVRGYGTLSTGTRILPVAVSIAIGSVGGAQLASRIGTRVVVVTGLLLFGASFAWIAASPTYMPYSTIAMQMVIMGLGLGLTSAPATESILSVLPPAKAGIGSAVNDATREAGRTLGVAIIGSVSTSAYLHHLAGSPFTALPAQLYGVARDSIGAGLAVAHSAPAAVSGQLTSATIDSFMHGLRLGCVVAAGVCWLGAVGALALPGRRSVGTTSTASTASSANTAGLGPAEDRHGQRRGAGRRLHHEPAVL